MDLSKLEAELKRYKHSENAVMSPIVRARLEETYASLPEMPAERKDRASRRRIGKTASVAAAAVMLGATVFASGFISPAMAHSIKQIPLVGSLFSSIEADLGLRAAGEQGLTSSVNKSFSYQDVKLQVTEAIFDGTRAAFLVKVSAPNLQDGLFDTGEKKVKLSNAIENVVFTVNGKGQDDPDSFIKGGIHYSWAGESHPDVLIFEETFQASSAPIPDAFQGEVTVKLAGIDHEFKLDVPFLKTTKDIIVLKPNVTQTNGEMSLLVSEVNVTPMEGETSDQLTHMRVAVFDDQGRQLPAINGEGTLENNSIVFDGRYATTQGHPKYLLVKPFIYEEDFSEKVRDDQFIKGLEMKIELPAAQN